MFVRFPFSRCAAIVALFAGTASAQIVVSEIHYHPVEEAAYNADSTPTLDLTDDIHEFVELQNAGTTPVNLGGWKLSGGADFTFPPGTTIPAGGFKVIAKNPARLQTVYGITGVLGPYTGKLKNSDDTVRVKDAAGTTIDAVSYSSHFPWPISANALGANDRFTGLSSASYQYKGRSLQRVSVTGNSNDPANWLASPLTGPTPGAAQAVTRSVPKPVVVAQSYAQSSDSAVIVRAGQAVTVAATFSSTASLTSVQVEYFLDDINSTTETRTNLAMTDLGNGRFAATLPGQVDRSIVRYRFKANRGDGVETVSPRADDPAVAPVGSGGAREAWHGYFVTPARTSTRPIYDLLVSTTNYATMGTNISQNPKRVTAANATGVPRDEPYVAATAPQWNGTVPAVFATDGVLYDTHIRYHGSRYHRATTNLSFKLYFADYQPFNNQNSWFVTGHSAVFAEVQSMYRQIGLPSSKMRQVDWYFNSSAVITRFEQGEWGNEMLDEYHELQQQLNPGTAKEARGELYKAVGNLDASQGNLEGPYTKADQAPMLANAGWTQLQRYDWTYALQSNTWKGPTQIRNLIEGMWLARGDTPASPTLANNAANLANTKAWFNIYFDIDSTLTAMALCQWIGIWDDTGHNQFFWRRANGKWVRLPWDFDDVMTGARATQSIYSNESGVNTFNGPNWWKDTFFKCYRTEFKQRLWELNNSYLDPANLAALGLPNASTFANTRQANVNTQVALGTLSKPARPTNSAPTSGAAILGGVSLATSAYSHPTSRPHASTNWEIRASTGDYEAPVFRLVSTTNLTSLPVPFDQLAYGATYYWRATHIDADGHRSIVSSETRFTWGSVSTTAGTLVLNEILADNRSAAPNGDAYPDFIEIQNNGATTATLAGLSLTDDPLAPAKYTFPAGTTLAVGAQIAVWCDSDTAAPGLHTGFALSASGQTVLLVNGTTILDSVSFGPQAPDISIGRITNGTGGWQANTPTAGTVNVAKTLGSPANLRVNEWMASPAYGDDWFEIFNGDANPVALGGLYLSDTPGDPKITQIPPLSFIAGSGFTKFLADGKDRGGNHCDFKLAAAGENLVITSASGVTTLDIVTFGAQASDVSQGRFPDGAATFASFPQTSSPARSNWLAAAVVINEALSNSTAPFEDAIEIHNPTASAVAIGGWWLSDDAASPLKFQIPAGTTIPAGGFTVFYESQFNAGAVPFGLSSAGGEIILSAVDGNGAPTGYRAQVNFGAAAENVSFGRVAVSGGAEFWAQTARTFGQDAPADLAQFRTGAGVANAAPKTTPIVINEVMYHPVDGGGGSDNTQDEFIEIHNTSATAEDVSGWRLLGDSTFNFAAGTSIPAGGYLLLVSFDPANAATLAAFRTKYGLTAAPPIYGPYSAKLSNGTQTLELAYPGQVIGTSTPFIIVDRVEYRDIAPWPAAADGGGSSLQRQSLAMIGNDAANWLAAAPTPGAVNAGVNLALVIASTSPLPGGVVNVGYSRTLTASGGSAPYAWNLLSGALPGGLSLSDAGVISGTPGAAGSFTFTAKVTDAANAVATKGLTLTIAASALDITTAALLPDGTYGAAYSQNLAASGGTTPYAWSVSAGSLPGGLSLSAGGVLSGTCTGTGAFNFTIRVADAGGLAVTKAFAIIVPAPPLTIASTSPMPGGTLGTAYSQALLAVGGVPSYTWTLATGTLPDGLSLSTTGDLTGTPTLTGTFNFTARVTDSLSTAKTMEFTLTVTAPPLVIASTSPLADGIVGSAYSQTLAVTGGVPSYGWSLASGALPPGLTLGASGAIAGTPNTAGGFTFTARVTDRASITTTKQFFITVAAHGPLDHFTWSHVPASVNAGKPFGVWLTARDAAERLVSEFSGAVTLTATSTGSSATPVVITELTDEAEDQVELQNVTSSAADTTGWFMCIGDSQTNINAINPVSYSLPVSVAAGGILRVSETNIAGRRYFGGAIDWPSSSGATFGWVMLFDAQRNLRDFVAFGWSAAQLATLSVTINGKSIAPVSSGQWSGGGLDVGTRGTVANTTDSWRRVGSGDNQTAADWLWSQNAQSLGATNAGLTLPWSTATPLVLAPAGVAFEDGQFVGYLTIATAANNVTLTANDGASHAGTSAAFTVAAALVDSDSDGMPDAWESANGLAIGVNDADGDFDGDGASNRAEYLAGTDPRSPASKLAISVVSVPGTGQISVTWPAVAGKLYRVCTSPDLSSWTPQTPFIPAKTTGNLSVLIDAGDVGEFFVRVEIAPMP